MSHIFDALQRSGAEQSGIAFDDVVSVVTEVFEHREQERKGDEAGSVASVQTPALPMPSFEVDPAKSQTVTEFLSIDARVDPSSKFVVATDPESLASEKFRFLGVRLRQLQSTQPIKKVLITSTIPEEGKSLVSANLAAVLARRKQRVLLIDGDLRRPVLAQQFGLGHLKGMAECLRGNQRKLDCIYHLENLDFFFMPAGQPPENPLELMSSGRLTWLMDEVAQLFDWVIIDSPPLLPLADTTVWARVSDGILLVTRVGNTERSDLMRGLESIKRSRLLGVILNSCVDPHRDNYYRRYSSVK